MAGKWSQEVQISLEGTAGTAESGGQVLWLGLGSHLKDNRETVMPENLLGLTTGFSTRNYTPKLEAGLELAATEATFEHICFLLSAGIKQVETGTADGDSASGYVYDYDVGAGTSENARSTLTVYSGDATETLRSAYMFPQTITLTWTATEAVMMSSSWIGRQIEDDQSLAAKAPETVETILGGKGEFYIDAPTSIPAPQTGTQITGTLLSGSITINTGLKPKYISDDGNLYFNFPYLDSSAFGLDVELVYEHDANAETELDAWRTNTPRTFSIIFIGDAYSDAGTTAALGGTKGLVIDFQGVYTDFSELSDDDGNSIVTATIKSGYSVTGADHFQIRVYNEDAALTTA